MIMRRQLTSRRYRVGYLQASQEEYADELQLPLHLDFQLPY